MGDTVRNLGDLASAESYRTTTTTPERRPPSQDTEAMRGALNDTVRCLMDTVLDPGNLDADSIRSPSNWSSEATPRADDRTMFRNLLIGEARDAVASWIEVVEAEHGEEAISLPTSRSDWDQASQTLAP